MKWTPKKSQQRKLSGKENSPAISVRGLNPQPSDHWSEPFTSKCLGAGLWDHDPSCRAKCFEFYPQRKRYGEGSGPQNRLLFHAISSELRSLFPSQLGSLVHDHAPVRLARCWTGILRAKVKVKVRFFGNCFSVLSFVGAAKLLVTEPGTLMHHY